MSDEPIRIACFAFWHRGQADKDAGQPPKSVACRSMGHSAALDLSLTSERRYTTDPKLDRFLRITIEEFAKHIQEAPFLVRESDTFRKSIFSSVMNNPGAYVEAPDAAPKPQDVSGDRAPIESVAIPESEFTSPPKTDHPVSPVPNRPDSDTRKKAKPVPNAMKPMKAWRRAAAEREKQDARRTEGHKKATSEDASAAAPIRQASLPPAPVEKPEPSLPDSPEIRTSSPTYERVRGGIDALREAIKTALSGGSGDAYGLMERLWDIFESLQSGRIMSVDDHGNAGSSAFVTAWEALGRLEQILYGTESGQLSITVLSDYERKKFAQEIADIVSILHPALTTK